MNKSDEVMIGLETHVQLNTNSKLFCGCATKPIIKLNNDEEDKPNSRCCPVCLGHPGSKPMLNQKVVDYALKLCLALGCKIEPKIFFSRKTYFYPDMSKNFQITQYEIPLGKNGLIKLKDGTIVKIERIHMEEDPAALVHEGSITESDHVLIDYNRSGIPLCEIVTTPCMKNPAQAREFLKELVRIIKYLNIFDEETCILKTDANVNIIGHPRIEVKNITGFKEIEKAMNYEVMRQKAVLKRISVSGKKVELKQSTMAWDTVTSSTKLLRTKETESDYGYIFDADLVKTEILQEMIDVIKKNIPELAHIRTARYSKKLGIDKINAEILSGELELAELFEKVAAKVDAKLAAKWLRRELLRVLNYNKKSLKDVEIDENHIIELLQMVENNEITETSAQKIMELLVEKSFSPKEYAKEHKLIVISDKIKLKEICKEVIDKNKKVVDDYLSGNDKAFMFLVGQVMKKTRGMADPKVVNEILKKLVK